MTKSLEEYNPIDGKVTSDKKEKARTIIAVTEGQDLFLPQELADMIAVFCDTPFSFQDIFQAARSGKNAKEIVAKILQNDDILKSEAIEEFLKDAKECVAEYEHERDVANSWFPYNGGYPFSFALGIESSSVVEGTGNVYENPELTPLFAPAFTPEAMIYLASILLDIVSYILALIEAIVIAPPVRLVLITKHSFFSSNNVRDKYGLDKEFITHRYPVKLLEEVSNEIKEQKENANSISQSR